MTASQQQEKKLSLQHANLVSDVTDSVFSFIEKGQSTGTLAEAKQFHAVYRNNSTGSVQPLYSSVARYFQISLDSAFRRFALSPGKQTGMAKDLDLYALNDNAVQTLVGAGGLVLLQVSPRSRLICVSVCDNYQVDNAKQMHLYQEVRDRVVTTELGYNAHAGLYLPLYP
jgi:hypothetical protein